MFDSEWLKKVASLRREQCEDRSWFPSQVKRQKHDEQHHSRRSRGWPDSLAESLLNVTNCFSSR